VWSSRDLNDELAMGNFSTIVSNNRCSWPCICKTHPLKNLITLFFNHQLCNKDGRKLVDENEDWCIYFVHVAKYVCLNGIGIIPRTKVGKTLV
jgi:hypothetical protein